MSHGSYDVLLLLSSFLCEAGAINKCSPIIQALRNRRIIVQDGLQVIDDMSDCVLVEEGQVIFFPDYFL